MNCRIFEKKLPEYLDESLLHDMKDAMEKHMDSCENCRNLYNQEMEFDKFFSNALQSEDMKFNSCRAEIIKEIDKNRYGKSPLKKIKYGMRKHKLQILSSAAVLMLTLTAMPFIIGSHPQKNTLSGTASEDKSKLLSVESQNGASDIKSPKTGSTEKSIALEDMQPIAFASDILENKVYVPVFERTKLEKLPDQSMSTVPKDSPDKNIQVLLNGRGPAAQDEGIADIVFQNQKDLGIWKLSVVDNEQKRMSPLSVNWYDNENVLVTMGYGNGHATFGGDLFLININTGKTLNLYPAHSKDKSQEVVSAARNGEMINIAVKQFDDAHNMSQDINVVFYFNEIYSSSAAEGVNGNDTKYKVSAEENKAAAVLKNGLAEGLNKGDTNALNQILGGNLVKPDSYQYKELYDINKVNVLKIVDMTKPSEDGQENTETYYSEIEINTKSDGIIFKNGVNFLAFKLEKDDKNNWIITDISRLPQN